MIVEPQRADSMICRAPRRKRWSLDWIGYRKRRKQDLNRKRIRIFWRVYVPLFCLFLAFMGCWEATRRWGVRTTVATLKERRAHAHEVPLSRALSVLPLEDPGAFLPFVVSVTHVHESKRFRCLYLWLFGPVVDTPFQWNMDLELLPPDDSVNL